MKLLKKYATDILRILAIIAALEMLIMVFKQSLPLRPGFYMIATDCILLALIGTPILYFGFFRRFQRETERRVQVENALKQEHGFISAVINATSSLVLVIDKAGHIIRCNQACEKTIGYAADELVGREVWEFYHYPADAEATRIISNRLPSGGSAEEHEHAWKTRSGDIRAIRWTYALLRSSPGGDDLIVMTGVDSTDRKHTEEKLAKAASEWELTFDSMVDGVSIHSTDYEIINVNSVLCKMLGMTREELIGKKCHEVFHHKKNPISECPLAKTRNSGEREFVELFEETIGGGTWLSVVTAPMLDDSGNIRNIIHVVRDISEQKQAEEALKGALHHNELILNNAGDGIFGVDTKGLITFINPAAASMLGCMPEKVTGKSFHALWHHSKDDGTPLPEAECAILSTARTGMSCTVTSATFWRADGTNFPVEYVGKGIIDQQKCQGAVVIFRDVSKTREVERQIRHQLENLAALHEIDLAITASIDLNITLKVILSQVVEQLDVDAADILLLDTRLNTFEVVASRGFRSDPERSGSLHVNQSVAGQAVLGRRMIGIANLKKTEERFVRSPLFVKEDFTTYHAVPLLTKGQIKGVLEVFHRRRFSPDNDWKAFLKTISAQAAIAIDNAGLFDDLQRSNSELVLAYDTTLEGWSRAMDLRDKETEGHTRRVSNLTLHLARAMKVPDADLIHMYRGALLHDVGKLGIPDSILLKPGKLNEEEWNIMKLHPRYAYELLSPISYLRPAIDIPYCHHERWDGGGYPRGLKKEQIPLAARIFSLVDVWDALCSDRPYRPAWPEEQVREHITSLAGSHFDPRVVDTFMKVDLQKAS